MAGPKMRRPNSDSRPPIQTKGTLKRLLKMLFTNNPALLSIVLVCIVLSATTGVASSLFLRNLLEQINLGLENGLNSVLGSLIFIFVMMGVVYATNVICSFIYTRLMATLTQKFLHQVRTSIFDKMQSLPISFFDRNKTGDLMSIYTNDTDALRQLVSQSIPQLCSALISVITLLCIMFSYSIWLTLVIFAGVIYCRISLCTAASLSRPSMS